jgi:type IV secretion system protein VirB9
LETEDIRDKSMMFVMRFSYPDDDIGAINYGGEDLVPDFEAEPEKYNFNYTVQGSDTISPIRIFDDGQFTYFEFRDKNADIPGFFYVDAAGNEELVNFRTRGNFIVVERVSPVFTLRRGAYILCIYNEALTHESLPPQPGFWDKVGSGDAFRF